MLFDFTIKCSNKILSGHLDILGCLEAYTNERITGRAIISIDITSTLELTLYIR